MSFTGSRYSPVVFTKPLRPDFVSDGPRLREFVRLFWKTEDGKPFELDPWQADLIDAILERYPDDWPDVRLRGRLRYRQCLVSMGRQNGKSVLGAVFGMYGLMMHMAGPYVLSLASNADQATIIYNRVKFVVDNHPSLNRRFKTTGTRGISRLDKPGTYKVKPAKADALQGIPVTLCLFDEVHICPPDMWSAVVLGTAAQEDGMVLGITTAGDDNSTLLKDLYVKGRTAAGEADSRFGFFLWEAPQGCALDDPEALKDANPALAAGRLDMENVLNDLRTMAEDDVRRYRLNQFVSSQSAWLPMSMWHKAATGPVEEGAPVFAIDRTPSWEHATITATVKTAEGVHTEVVTSINKPTLERLVELCEHLWQFSPRQFVMDGWMLADLAEALRNRGYPVKALRQNEVTTACSTAYALLATGKARHANDPVVNRQMPFAVRKNVGDAWRINRAASKHDIDAVMATVFGMYEANKEEAVMQIF